MVRNSSIVWMLAFSLFIMAGCERYTDDGPEPEERQITVNFTASELSGSLLKATPSIAESSIEKVILFGVDAQHNVVDTFMLTSSGAVRSIPKTIKTLWAVANPTATMLAAAIPVDSTALMTMTADFTTAPQSPFLMSGKVRINTSTSVAIKFARTVARVELAGIANKFQIESVTVKAAATGYIFDRLPWSVPAMTWVTYSYTGSNPVIYLAEHSSTNPVLFTVTGRFLDQSAHLQQPVVSDPFSIKSDEGHDVDVKRNTSYQVDVGFEWN